jgi:hypothetical protein
MRSWRNVERRGHEGKEKDQQSEERTPAATGIERRGIVNGGNAEEAHRKDHGGPKVPTIPEMEESEHGETSGKEKRRKPVPARIERTENMATVELGNRDEVERG